MAIDASLIGRLGGGVFAGYVGVRELGFQVPRGEQLPIPLDTIAGAPDLAPGTYRIVAYSAVTRAASRDVVVMGIEAPTGSSSRADLVVDTTITLTEPSTAIIEGTAITGDDTYVKTALIITPSED